jgi:hypothetical protein
MDVTYALDRTPRRAIASFSSYEAAEALVNRLADRGFPVARLTIVGRDPELVERVTGRLDAGRALLAGAAGGAMFGVLFGLLFGILFTHDGVSLLAILVYWTLLAAVFGATFGVAGYALADPRRSHTSEQMIRASRYEVLAEEPVADEALRLNSVTRTPGGDHS